MDDHSKTYKAAFIDRDGVINVEREYVYRVRDFEFLPNAIAGMLILQDAGYKLVIVTNQSGIARGYYSEASFQVLTNYMKTLLIASGVVISGVYHCPHHPTAGLGVYKVECTCRKPKPGMLYQAKVDLNLDLSSSILIGDKHSDIAAGRAAGLRQCVLVRSGHLPTSLAISAADACVDDLKKAAAWIVSAT
jgi:D-glycero-D-manno-heptose 1,7-bisphosphate phosphatase